MTEIAGFCSAAIDFRKEPHTWEDALVRMETPMRTEKRAEQENGERDWYFGEYCTIAYRDCILAARRKYYIAFSGELYNPTELYEEVKELLHTKQENKTEYQTPALESKASDAEIVLAGFVLYGELFFEKINGVFACAIWDESEKRLFLVRDRLGIKPLFYSVKDTMLLFASKIRGILGFPGFRAEVDREGLCEIFALGPAKTPGKGVFKGIQELLPGSILKWDENGIRTWKYWTLKAMEHTETLSQTVEHTTWLVEDAVKRQMRSDTQVGSLLSGGLDSSLVTAICAAEYKKQGKRMNTYSFDFTGNHENFKASRYQPSEDRPYAEQMARLIGSSHTILECDKEELAAELYPSVCARDLPGMADVESSILYFGRIVAKQDSIVLTGECADEVFGGYPWYHREDLLAKDGFPWSNEFSMRTAMLREDVIAKLQLKEYEDAAYRESLKDAPLLASHDGAEKRRQQIAWLNLNWFMVTLVDRMERTASVAGLTARVPYADYRIVEYIYNTPWNLKCPDNMVKGLLRMAGEKYLPKEILYRKKSPYPKTYDPKYELLIRKWFAEMLENKKEPIHELIDGEKAKAFMQMASDYAKPWYGQLMAGPQLYAYLLMVNYWMKQYHVELV